MKIKFIIEADNLRDPEYVSKMIAEYITELCGECYIVKEQKK